MAKPLKVQVFGRKIWPVAFQGCSICCQNLSPDDSPARKKELVLKIGRAGCETGRESFLFSILLLERFSSEQQIKFRGSFPTLTSFGGLGGVRFMVGLDLKGIFQSLAEIFTLNRSHPWWGILSLWSLQFRRVFLDINKSMNNFCCQVKDC